MANTPNRYLRPWSTVDDEELKLLRQLKMLCDDLKSRGQGEIMYMQGGAALHLGAIGAVLRALDKIP